MAACLSAPLLQRPLVGLGKLSIAARTVMGVAVGASLTPEVVSHLLQMAASVALVPIYIIVIAPGGQAEMTVLFIVAGADLGIVIVHHLTRVFLVITGALLAARWLMKNRN